MKDAFDLWWESAQKPHERFLMIDADIHNPIKELSPEDRRYREKVNDAVRQYRHGIIMCMLLIAALAVIWNLFGQ